MHVDRFNQTVTGSRRNQIHKYCGEPAQVLYELLLSQTVCAKSSLWNLGRPDN